MEDFVSIEQAVKLEELGFNEEVFFHFNSETKEIAPIEGASYSEGGPFDTYDVLEDVTKYGLIPAPTLSQAQKWLRNVKGIDIDVQFFFGSEGKLYYIYIGQYSKLHYERVGVEYSYEKALSAGISKALELLKQEKNGNKA